MKPHSISATGFSLIEVLLGFAILAMAVGVSADGVGILTKRLGNGRMNQIARGLIQQRLVELEAEPLHQGATNGKFGNDFPAFAFRQTIDPVSYLAKPLKGVFRLRLAIEWENEGVRDSTIVETFLTDFSEAKKKEDKSQNAGNGDRETVRAPSEK